MLKIKQSYPVEMGFISVLLYSFLFLQFIRKEKENNYLQTCKKNTYSIHLIIKLEVKRSWWKVQQFSIFAVSRDQPIIHINSFSILYSITRVGKLQYRFYSCGINRSEITGTDFVISTHENNILGKVTTYCNSKLLVQNEKSILRRRFQCRSPIFIRWFKSNKREIFSTWFVNELGTVKINFCGTSNKNNGNTIPLSFDENHEILLISTFAKHYYFMYHFMMFEDCSRNLFYVFS